MISRKTGMSLYSLSYHSVLRKKIQNAFSFFSICNENFTNGNKYTCIKYLISSIICRWRFSPLGDFLGSPKRGGGVMAPRTPPPPPPPPTASGTAPLLTCTYLCHSGLVLSNQYGIGFFQMLNSIYMYKRKKRITICI